MPRDLIDRRPVEEVAAVVLPVIGSTDVARSRLEESQGLAEALGVKLAFAERLNIREPNPARLFGSGQVDTLNRRMHEDGVTLLIVDGALTPVQQRNLEKAWKAKANITSCARSRPVAASRTRMLPISRPFAICPSMAAPTSAMSSDTGPASGVVVTSPPARH